MARKRTHSQKDDVLVRAFVYLRTDAENGLSPTGRRMALRSCREILWALGLKEFDGMTACAPDPHCETIEGTVIPMIADKCNYPPLDGETECPAAN